MLYVAKQRHEGERKVRGMLVNSTRSTLKNGAKKRIMIASVTMPETPQTWTPSRWRTLTPETYLMSRRRIGKERAH